MSLTEQGDVSRYVTVFKQLAESETGTPGDRFAIHGEHHNTRYKRDEEAEDFVPLAEPVAVIDVGTDLHEDEMTEWCNSHAGKAVLAPFFDGMEAPEPTLPDAEVDDGAV